MGQEALLAKLPSPIPEGYIFWVVRVVCAYVLRTLPAYLRIDGVVSVVFNEACAFIFAWQGVYLAAPQAQCRVSAAFDVSSLSARFPLAGGVWRGVSRRLVPLDVAVPAHGLG